MTIMISNNPATQIPRGAMQVLTFNCRSYVSAIILIATSIAAIVFVDLSMVMRIVIITAMAFAAYWSLASLVVSQYVYNRPELIDFGWLSELLTPAPLVAANIHAGFDQSTHPLRTLFPQTRWHVLDTFDPQRTGERSIAIARHAGAGGATQARIEALPLATHSCDALFLIFAAHEIRLHRDRERFFVELDRILAPGGVVVLVEHLRDINNFLAFGPGFTHFFSRRQWFDLVRNVGWIVEREQLITPFVRCFLFRRQP